MAALLPATPSIFITPQTMDVARVAAAALLQTLEHNRSDMTRTALTPEEQAQLEDQARTVTGPRAARRTHYAVPQSAKFPRSRGRSRGGLPSGDRPDDSNPEPAVWGSIVRIATRWSVIGPVT